MSEAARIRGRKTSPGVSAPSPYGPDEGPLMEVMANCPDCGSLQFANDGTLTEHGRTIVYRKCIAVIDQGKPTERVCGCRRKVIRVTMAQVAKIVLKGNP